MITVSIIMNCLNGEAYLADAIDSVYAQSYWDWEIIFIDNASTDNSGEIANRYDDKLRYFYNSETVSLGAARNQALAHCRGKYVAFLDCDDLWLPSKLERQVRQFERSKNTSLSYSNAIYFNEKKEKILFSKVKPAADQQLEDQLRQYNICMPSVMIQKKYLDQLDAGFDDQLHVGEDTDLFLRLAYLAPINYIHEPLVKYRLHRNSCSVRQFELFHGSLELILKKLTALYPDISTAMPEAIEKFREQSLIYKGFNAILKNQVSVARQILRPIMWKNKSAFKIFVVTLLGSRIANYVLDRRRHS